MTNKRPCPKCGNKINKYSMAKTCWTCHSSKPPHERFFKYVKKTPNCWEWTGGRFGSNHYGQFSINGGNMFSHRYSWIFHNGDIPKGKFVLHSCDNPICVNPKHLFIGTSIDNKRDSMNKRRHSFGENCFHKLKRKDVIKIRNLRFKITRKNMSKMFKVHEHTIDNILDYKYWRHVK